MGYSGGREGFEIVRCRRLTRILAVPAPFAASARKVAAMTSPERPWPSGRMPPPPPLRTDQRSHSLPSTLSRSSLRFPSVAQLAAKRQIGCRLATRGGFPRIKRSRVSFHHTQPLTFTKTSTVRAYLAMEAHVRFRASQEPPEMAGCRAPWATSQFFDSNRSCAACVYSPAMWAIGDREPARESAICTCGRLRWSFS